MCLLLAFQSRTSCVQELSREWRHRHFKLARARVTLGEIDASCKEPGACRADDALVDEQGVADVRERDEERRRRVVGGGRRGALVLGSVDRLGARVVDRGRAGLDRVEAGLLAQEVGPERERVGDLKAERPVERDEVRAVVLEGVRERDAKGSQGQQFVHSKDRHLDVHDLAREDVVVARYVLAEPCEGELPLGVAEALLLAVDVGAGRAVDDHVGPRVHAILNLVAALAEVRLGELPPAVGGLAGRVLDPREDRPAPGSGEL